MQHAVLVHCYVFHSQSIYKDNVLHVLHLSEGGKRKKKKTSQALRDTLAHGSSSSQVEQKRCRIMLYLKQHQMN